MRFKVLLAAASVLTLSACASAGPDPKALRGAIAPNYSLFDMRTSYGQFLAGQAALRDGRPREAADYFGAAGALSDDAEIIDERTFTALLLSGEVTRAAMVAPQGQDATEAVKRLGALTRVVELLASGKGKEAQALLKAGPIGFPHRQISTLLGPWVAAAAGDAEGAVVQPVLQNDRLVEYFGQLGQARLYERARRYDEAETDYKALTGTDATAGLFTLDYGAFLERRKRHADAVALYDQALAATPDDTALQQARARAFAKQKPPAAPTLKQGAAQNLVACAATFAGERQTQFALAYLRLALRLDPERDEAWFLVGDLLNQGNDHAGAIDAFSHILPDSPQYLTAQGKLAWTYQESGDKVRALEIAKATALSAPGDRSAQITLADLLRVNERWGEAVSVLDKLVAQEANQPDWRVLYLRGISLERADRWPEAERDLGAALKLNPDEPELLNFLGYSWIDRNENLPQALAMVQKAVDARPQSGAMLDSLGWAYYRLGDYKKAVEKLEAAVELEPGDPDVNDHLGDAYWRAERRIEAQFQWRRVLSLEPNDKQKVSAEAKLKNGLGASLPTGPSTIAST